MRELFVRPGPAALLLALRDTSRAWYLSSLARAAGLTYVHTTKTVSKFAAAGIVTLEEKGRVKMVKLTEKGLAVANAMSELLNKLEPGEEKK